MIHALATTPGFFLDPSGPSMTDALVRYSVNYILQSTRRGARFSAGEHLSAYLENPKGRYVDPPVGAFKFCVPSTENPSFVKMSGMRHDSTSQLGKLVFFSGKRKGKCIDLNVRKMKCPMNLPVAQPKYSTAASKFFQLDPNALPVGTPDSLIKRAQDAFNCSLAKNTLSNYSTAVRHLNSLETMIGRRLITPFSHEDQVLYVSYLANRNVQKATIASYLSALRHYETAKGIVNPIQNSELTKKLLCGIENSQRDPEQSALKKQRRPITGRMLTLLGHAIADGSKSDYEQSLTWTVCLSAFWGSFRISELLCEYRNEFNPKCSLMLSDIQIEDECFSVWLRSEKVSSKLGNVVEVWSVDGREDLDPVIAMKCFLDRRNAQIKDPTSVPVFVHEDGTNLTKGEFNEDLKFLLSKFPELSSSERDSWTGHSFRSGISTMLQSLGFSEQEIMQWGRWKSEAYKAYLKDMTARKKVHSKLKNTFQHILQKM